ncbi:MAG: hypothetical protein QM778_00515 [Myxococcales bacterium]
MTPRTKIALTLLGLLLVVITGRVWYGFGKQPQLSSNNEVFKTVDGLFTAVTARDEQKLMACEQRLMKYESAGDLPSAASKRLKRVIATARSGQWESAARQLYDFMHGQRNERASTSLIRKPSSSA